MLYGLADCNNFFCSCERAFRPDLRTRPVVVLSNNDGCVVARSNESKALGIKMGDVFYQVKDRLEQNNVAVFSSNYTLYGDMSRRVMSMLSRYTPRLEIYSIDEAFLDYSWYRDTDRMLADSREMVSSVTRGVGIPISVGIAPTRTLAKMASKFAKKYPGYKGVCLINDEESRRRALQLYDVGDVWGIGYRYARRLADMNVRTAWDLAQKPLSWIKHHFNVVGVRTWKELRGEDCISVDELPMKKSICTSRSFPDMGLNRLGDVEEAVANFAAACVRKLRAQHAACAAMTVFASTSPFRLDLPQDHIHTTVALETASSNLGEVVNVAVNALRRHWKDTSYYYKRAGVIVWDICPDDAIQLSLFDETDRKRLDALQKTIDGINLRNGDNTVRVAVQGYGKRWHLKNEYISRHFTTNLRDILVVR